MSTELKYEPISGDYVWTTYGEFRVVLSLANGYMNGTQLCKDFEKRINDWSRLDSYKELVKELSNTLNVPEQTLTFVIFRGFEKPIRGVYVHPLLIPALLNWINPSFAVFTARIVSNYISSNGVHKLTLEEKMDKLLNEVQKSANILVKLDTTNTEIVNALNTLQLDNVEDLTVICLSRSERKYRLNRSRSNSLNLRPRNTDIVFKLTEILNGKEIVDQIKTELITLNCAVSPFNDITLSNNVSESQLINIIKRYSNQELTADTLQSMTLAELKQLAKQTGKRGYSSLNKAQLIQWILTHQPN